MRGEYKAGASFVNTNFSSAACAVIAVASFGMGMLTHKVLIGESGESHAPDSDANADLDMRFREFLRLKSDCLGNCEQRTRALEGDMASARAMALSANKLNPTLREYWTQVGAENGDSVSQYNLAVLLIESGNAQDVARALFWLNRARENGDNDAARLAQELEGRAVPGDSAK